MQKSKSKKDIRVDCALASVERAFRYELRFAVRQRTLLRFVHFGYSEDEIFFRLIYNSYRIFQSLKFERISNDKR